jgi:hypothetical protein
VAGRRWQPFEAHIPFMLQLKIDFNLAGMGFLRLSRVHFRAPLPASGARRGADWCGSPAAAAHEPSDPSAAPSPAALPCSLGPDAPRSTFSKIAHVVYTAASPALDAGQGLSEEAAATACAQLRAQHHSLPTARSAAAAPESTAPVRVRAGPVLGGSGAAEAPGQLWTAGGAPADWLQPPGGRALERQSVCELEADACADAILNRAEVCRGTCCGLALAPGRCQQ